MAVQVSAPKRVFKFDKNGDTVTLPDPNPDFTAEEVLRFYSGQYPELTTAALTGPEIKDGKAVYSVEESVGTKG